MLLGREMPLGVSHIGRRNTDVTVLAVERRFLGYVLDAMALQNAKACGPGAPSLLNHV